MLFGFAENQKHVSFAIVHTLQLYKKMPRMGAASRIHERDGALIGGNEFGEGGVRLLG